MLERLTPPQNRPLALGTSTEAGENQQDSSEGDSRITKRPRASRPKVKSGCITCKTRRVKCDETKPQCLRCQKFGRRCDGYLEPSSRGVAIIPIKPRIPSTLNIYSPSLSVPGSEEEHRYFRAFRENSVIELSGFFSNDFWASLVLQESDAMTPVRHAVIALGALNKSLESAPGPQLKVNVIQEVDRRHHINAVAHYHRAIQSLNQYISTSQAPQLRVALISCLLFICFETFQGSFASSVQQTYGGLKILRSHYSGKPGSRPWIPRKIVQNSSASISTNINRTVQNKPGCDNVSMDQTMSSQLEEYLTSETIPRASLDQRPLAKVRRSSTQTTDSFNRLSPGGRGSTPKYMRKHSVSASTIPKGSIQGASTPIPAQPSKSHKSEPQTLSYFLNQKTLSVRTSSNRSYSAESSPAANISAPKASLDEESTSQEVPMSRKRTLASRSETPSTPPTPLLQNDLTLEDSLIQTFVRLDGQGLFFGMIPGIPPLIWDIYQVHHIPIPERFDDFAAAQRCWDFLMDRTLQFYRRTRFDKAYAPSNAESPPQIARQHAAFVKELSEFKKAFEPILDSAIDQDGTVLNSAALLISLYQKITIITLASVRTDSEMVYDNFLPDFQYITKTCATLIESQTSLQRRTRYAFEVGIVPPLHVTASKCRDPLIRREAVALLFASPRQEGMWDAVLSARIGKWLTSCEEDGLPPPPLDYRESSASHSPPESDSLADERFNYPSPPQVGDDVPIVGGWENGKRISHSVNEAIIGAGGEGPIVANRLGIQRRKASAKGKGKVNRDKGWIVPEEHRVQLMVVDFHIPDRYIKVKCQKALLREDGSREERETVIAW